MNAPTVKPGDRIRVPRAHWYSGKRDSQLVGECRFASDQRATVAEVSDFGRNGVRVLVRATDAPLAGWLAWRNLDEIEPDRTAPTVPCPVCGRRFAPTVKVPSGVPGVPLHSPPYGEIADRHGNCPGSGALAPVGDLFPDAPTVPALPAPGAQSSLDL